MTDLRARMENWGACRRSGGRARGEGMQYMHTKETRRTGSGGGQGFVCMTGVICNTLKMQAGARRPWIGDRGKLDYEDAYRISMAWTMLKERHRTMLEMTFVDNQPPNVICRKLGIRHWPADHFKEEFYAAEDAIAAMLLKLGDLPKGDADGNR